jgi:putative sterol carrier protein
VIGRLSDRQLDFLLSFRLPVWMIFVALTHRLQPQRAPAFSGDIQFQIAAGGRRQVWVVRIREGKASLRANASAEPALVLRASAPVFARVLSGELNAGAAALEGKLEFDGDFRSLDALLKMLS